ncbi:MAG: extracellular solute-binding protein, partial [Bifidobacteriaceae bacterium]|nr:extracellular solute-binding protein [Bifidobacteriaceae bacterium]
EGMEVLNFWQKMLDAGVYEVGFENTKTDQFAAGNAAMRLDAPWDWANLKASGVKYAFAEPPAGPNGDKGSMTGGFGLAIPKGAKHAEGAWDFIKWFAANEDNELAFCKLAQWLPADKAVAQDDYFKTDEWTPFVKSLEFAKARPQTPGWQEAAQKALDPYFQRFMNGELTAKQALDQSSQQMDSLLAKSFSE